MDDISPIIEDEYIDEITKCISERKRVSEDLMYALYQKILLIIKENAYGAVTDRIKDFCLYMSQLGSSHKHSEIVSDQVLSFQLGELYSFTRLLNAFILEKDREDDLVDNSTRFLNRRDFFQIVSENPGIKHTVLADKMHISKSSLSQFTAKIKGFRYHYERFGGREKYYYLTATGIQLLKLMNEKMPPKTTIYPRPTTWKGSKDFTAYLKVNPLNIQIYAKNIDNDNSIDIASVLTNSTSEKQSFIEKYYFNSSPLPVYSDKEIEDSESGVVSEFDSLGVDEKDLKKYLYN